MTVVWDCGLRHPGASDHHGCLIGITASGGERVAVEMDGQMDGFADSAALRACAGDADIALCTVVGIEGAFSRRVGAQLAVSPSAPVAGTLADGCLENQLVRDCLLYTSPSPRD